MIPFLAINSRYSQYSPGGILITEEVKKMIMQHQMGYFDLSRGNEKYKFDYGGTLHTNHWYEFCLDGKAVENRPVATRP